MFFSISYSEGIKVLPDPTIIYFPPEQHTNTELTLPAANSYTWFPKEALCTGLDDTNSDPG
jgi:hypothetical protein